MCIVDVPQLIRNLWEVGMGSNAKAKGKKWRSQAVSGGERLVERHRRTQAKKKRKGSGSVLSEAQREIDRALTPALTMLRSQGRFEEMTALLALSSMDRTDDASLRRAEEVIVRIIESMRSKQTSDIEPGATDRAGGADRWSSREVMPRNPEDMITYLEVLLKFVRILLLFALALKSPEVADTVVKEFSSQVSLTSGNHGSTATKH
ncbi:hypothetical protein [Actinoplanes sp. NPDC051411]|uniref:hypothetical protein n=1 Tax=Actinoplanes sp. NPDC051411 TaxID=3155522 RepID=UPI00341ADDC8